MQYKLQDVANVIRSKNAGPFELTFDILLKDDHTFRMIQKAGVINKKAFASLYKLKESDVLSILYFPNARAIKVTIIRPLPSGALGERDVYGAQQHVPLMNYTFELDG